MREKGPISCSGKMVESQTGTLISSSQSWTLPTKHWVMFDLKSCTQFKVRQANLGHTENC